MKKFKKIFAAIAASALVAAMSFTSMAASITINRSDTTDTSVPGAASDTVQYTYYRVLKANISGDKGDNVSYYVDNETLKDAIVGNASLNALFKVNEYTEDGNKKWNVVPKRDYSKLSEEEEKEAAAEEIASAFNEIKDKVPHDPHDPQTREYFGTFSRANGTDSATATLPGDGYYLIVSSLGTKLAVQTAGNDDIVISEKNEYPTLTKAFETTADKSLNASYGNEISYKVSVKIPQYAAAETDIQVIDVMDNGLTPCTYDDGKLKVVAKEGSNPVTDVTSSAVKTVDGDKQQITITIPATKVTANRGKTVDLVYKAKLNSNAKVNENQENTAQLKYGNYTGLVTEPVSVKTFGIKLKKLAGSEGNSTELAEGAGDAKFTLYDSNNKMITLTKDASSNTYKVDPTALKSAEILAGEHSGEATINGLKDGTYYLQEDVAPTGYNKLTEKVEVSITGNEEGGYKNAVVYNNAGIKLPSTGGMGTTVFAIVGLLVMAGAAVTLIVKKRA